MACRNGSVYSRYYEPYYLLPIMFTQLWLLEEVRRICSPFHSWKRAFNSSPNFYRSLYSVFTFLKINEIENIILSKNKNSQRSCEGGCSLFAVANGTIFSIRSANKNSEKYTNRWWGRNCWYFGGNRKGLRSVIPEKLVADKHAWKTRQRNKHLTDYSAFW